MTVDTRRTFHQQLESIRDDLVRLAAVVCEAIPRGTLALLDGDLAAAQALIDADPELDRQVLDVEELCYRELALQQPMASDMRALVTAIRLTSEIERSGDLVANIAKAGRRVYGLVIDPKVRGLLQSMNDEALRLWRHAIDAYADSDEGKASALDDMDDTLDALHVEYIAQILESCRGGSLDIQAAVQLALVGRYYERIGDHAVNIGHRVCYMVSGWLPERRPADEVDEVDEVEGT
jgi:phosphate transport system protein